MIYKTIEDFEANTDEAFKAAYNGETVEIWENAEYYTLNFVSLQAEQDA